MCGRISQPTFKEIAAEFHPAPFVEDEAKLNQFNIAVGQTAYVVLFNETRIAATMQFGTNFNGKYSFNARAEGYLNQNNAIDYNAEKLLHTSPFYTESFKNRRCLIPVNSFIEGSTQHGLNKPFSVSLNYTKIFALAGIWILDSKTNMSGFTIITCWPNQFITGTVNHHRLPVILEQDNWEDWLDSETDVEDMVTLLRPYYDDFMQAEPIHIAYKSPDYHAPYSDVPPKPAQQSLF